ncbi:hypothetical protein [Streptomyces pinistramenti]|uniref:hypothetical protein n=1 Tax=Streptomyces pinistramenti TaxID=2884812 RepID=UPI001D069D95|nr:hypothetical protein [Streptomyces pinistramenti]MCB5906122.1 hypothetical protein [Streptomyces pinistramenti]
MGHGARCTTKRCCDELAQHHGKPIEIPGDVAEMVDTVYADLYELSGLALDDDRERAHREATGQAVADAVAIPAPHNLADLYHLTDRDIDPAQITTRLGAELGLVREPDSKGS